jgi:ribonuclease PH
LRLNGRLAQEMRQISIEPNILDHAEGSCLIRMGNTHVICTATIDESIPPFLRGKGKGWVTAEYGMLPRSTQGRMKRESAQGKQSGRTQEIQRLIGRSLRAITDLEIMGERQILIDCDVIRADGGTRCASITGAYVAMYLTFKKLVKRGTLHKIPLIGELAAISCGIVNGQALVDLDYIEDSSAEVDANFVMSSTGGIIEIQATAEESPFNEEQFNKMLSLAKDSIEKLTSIQREILGY